MANVEAITQSQAHASCQSHKSMTSSWGVPLTSDKQAIVLVSPEVLSLCLLGVPGKVLTTKKILILI